jgi:hypothetical protein
LYSSCTEQAGQMPWEIGLDAGSPGDRGVPHQAQSLLAVTAPGQVDVRPDRAGIPAPSTLATPAGPGQVGTTLSGSGTRRCGRPIRRPGVRSSLSGRPSCVAGIRRCPADWPPRPPGRLAGPWDGGRQGPPPQPAEV